MTVYDEAPYYRINRWIENRLRGIKELNGTVLSSQVIIPPKASYVTDVDTNDRFSDVSSNQAIPFLSPGGVLPETLTVYNSTTKAYSQLPVGTYTVGLHKNHDEPWKLCGQIAYTFMFGEQKKLTEIVNFVETLTKREDKSAYDCNWFYRNDATYPFDMKSINFLTAAGPTPSKDEGGPALFVVAIGYDATYEGPNRVGDYGDETDSFMWN
jgi:hypothetical protein